MKKNLTKRDFNTLQHALTLAISDYSFDDNVHKRDYRRVRTRELDRVVKKLLDMESELFNKKSKAKFPK